MGAALAIFLGLVLVVLGGILITNYRDLGKQIVEKTIPNLFRVGKADDHGKTLGYCYFLGGVVFIVVGIVVAAR
jgi:hypothetical protein